MTKLTLDLQTSAEVLGTTPDHFLAWLQNEQPSGIITLDNQPQVSIFTLARILDTTAQELLNLLSISKNQDLLASQVNSSTQEIDTEIPIWESFTIFAQSLSPEILDRLPTDGAANHDHYLYGSPKRSI
ncbi:hypothetical protein [Pseudanabaena sp. FACHB-1998]|uniref:hypothetical protein n=1 Tax=Pseudanabaena sp. FACHB-1998 TaxID=2692858 RepID=UPI0016809309|nr:hypothetical protein [Pseudanabaena sp. FACHB-1998]